MTAALVKNVRQEYGERLTWKEAEELCCVSYKTIQARARGVLKELNPSFADTMIEALLDKEGVQFTAYGYELWVARREGRLVVRAKKAGVS